MYLGSRKFNASSYPSTYLPSFYRLPRQSLATARLAGGILHLIPLQRHHLGLRRSSCRRHQSQFTELVVS